MLILPAKITSAACLVPVFSHFNWRNLLRLTTLGCMSKRYQSFSQFWPFYVSEHSLPRTRLWHFVGTASLLPIILIAVFYNLYLLLLLPLFGYGFAWYSHFFVEKNRPATFRYPLWSLVGDFRMFALMCLGKMDAEVERCRKLETDSNLEDVSSDEAVDGM